MCLILQSEQRTVGDQMCQINNNILCVRDEFKEITSKAAYIVQKTLEIEQSVSTDHLVAYTKHRTFSRLRKRN